MSLDIEAAKTLAVKWLAASDKTEAEIRVRLERKGFEQEVITSALLELKERRWLDDARVLEREADQARLSPVIGVEKARHKMLQRGLDDDAVAAELENWEPDEEATKAESFLRRKMIENPAQAARLLAARGFQEEAIRTALDRVFPDWES